MASEEFSTFAVKSHASRFFAGCFFKRRTNTQSRNVPSTLIASATTGTLVKMGRAVASPATYSKIKAPASGTTGNQVFKADDVRLARVAKALILAGDPISNRHANR